MWKIIISIGTAKKRWRIRRKIRNNFRTIRDTSLKIDIIFFSIISANDAKKRKNSNENITLNITLHTRCGIFQVIVIYMIHIHNKR